MHTGRPEKYWEDKVLKEDVSDDILPFHFITRHKIPFSDVNVDNIIGPFIDIPHENILNNQKWDDLKNCSTDIISSSPYYNFIQFNKAMIWHGGCASNIAVKSGQMLFERTPDDVIVLSCQWYSILCRKTPMVDTFKVKPTYS